MLEPKLLHQIGDRSNGPNFNTLEEVLSCKAPLSFDGIYESVWDNYKALKGRDVTFFVMGKYLGGDNAFDHGQPLSRYCNISQILEMSRYLKAPIGYHGWAHRRCVGLTRKELVEELKPPHWLKLLQSGAEGAKSLAWPYGDYDDLAVEVAKELGYVEAWSVTQGDGSQYGKKRSHLNW